MAKKFERRAPKKKWTLEQTYQRRSLIDKEIADINRAMNMIDKEIKNLVHHVKPSLQRKIANKWRYRRQLEAQIIEIKTEKDEHIQKFDLTSHDNNSFIL